MARHLMLSDLAAESGADTTLVQRLAEIGVIRPDEDGRYSSGDLIRVDAARSFLDAGVPLDKIAEAVAHDLFTFEYLDRFHPEPSPRSNQTLADLATSLGISDDSLSAVYLAMGLREPGPGYRASVEEAEILRRFTELWGRGGVDALVRAARLVGEPARLLSEGWTRLYVEKIAPEHTVGPADERIASIVETTEKATTLAPQMFQWLLQSHLRRAIDRANIEGLEAAMIEAGLELPQPEILPAVAFVDISGYTSMTESQGDVTAVRVSETIRKSTQRVVQAHEGSLVKLLGDGAMVHFADAGRAVAAVSELVVRLAEEGLTTHAGINAGSVMEHDGDYYGSTVNLASRITDQAAAGEILVSASAMRNTHDPGFRFEALTPAEVEGVTHPLELYRVSTSVPLEG